MPLVPLPGPNRDRLRAVRRGLAAGVLAVVGHGLFVLLLLFLSLVQLNVPEGPRRKKAPSRPVVMRGISAQQWAQNRGDAPPAKSDAQAKTTPRPEKKKEKPVDSNPPGQVVDVAPGNDQVDPNAKYLAESNNAVKKESRAKEQTAFYRNAAPMRTSPNPHEGDGSDAVEKAQIAGNNGLGADDGPLKDKAAQKQVFVVPLRR